MILKDNIVKDFWVHALEEYPKEACGLVIDDSYYLPMKNHHANPKLNFKMDQDEFFSYYQAGRVTALLHSHVGFSPEYNNYPSLMDMVAQENMQVPWGIVHISPDKDIDGPFFFGDQVPIADFVGRKFRPNVHDCYILLRDVYRVEENITLPTFPREGQWYMKKGSHVLRDNFEKAGFEQIDKMQLAKNNVVLATINPPKENKTMNHVMIMRDKGLVLHHLNNRLSAHTPAHGWVNDSCICLRYKGETT